MTLTGLFEIALTLALVAAAAYPAGAFMADVFENRRTFLTPLLRPVERALYRVAGVDAEAEQEWLEYTLSMVIFGGACLFGLYALLRLQGWLRLNPQGFPGVSPDLAFNIAVSFITNANWQAYGGETTLSHLSQMVGLTANNFLDSAAAIAIAVALIRALSRNELTTIGNFWVDITRATLYILLPLALVVALAFAALGVPQTLSGSVEATTIEGAKQIISIGPVASSGGDQADRRQRRRVLQRQFRPPVRESERLVEHPSELEPARFAGRPRFRLRPHGQRPEAGAGAARGDGGRLPRRARRLLLV